MVEQCRGHKHPNCNYLACIACNKCGKGVPHVAPASSLVTELLDTGCAGPEDLHDRAAAEIQRQTERIDAWHDRAGYYKDLFEKAKVERDAAQLQLEASQEALGEAMTENRENFERANAAQAALREYAGRARGLSEVLASDVDRESLAELADEMLAALNGESDGN